MVEDVPPYWIYLPRNLSYVGDQVWDYFICCRRRKAVSMDVSVEWNPDDPDDGALVSPKSPDSLDDSGHFDDIFLDLKSKSDAAENGSTRSDYESDLNSPPPICYDSDVTISDCGDCVPIITMDDTKERGSVEQWESADYDNTPTPEPAELEVTSETVDISKKTSESSESSESGKMKPSERALNLFKDQANNNEEKKRMSFLDLLAPEAGFFDEQDGEFPAPELRRSTSLKSQVTPPGTPRRKKAVRFADTFGLDLEQVRHVLNLDSPPRIPASAVADLKPGIEKDHVTEGNKYFHAMFAQPGANGGFVQRVLSQKISLENAMINNLTISGTVRVANISYHKRVFIRFTVNGWTTSGDVNASYVLNSCDGATDRFSFTICSPPEMDVGKRLEFAVCFETQGQQYWDNNFGQNYVVECYARAMPTLASDNAWLHFL